MSDDIYRLIQEKGKHLAESHNTEGAFRGVYLDDKTNKPSGAGEFVKVNRDDLIEHYDVNTPVTCSDSFAGMGKTIIACAGTLALGWIAAKAAPHVKKWTLEKASPAIKRLFKRDLTDEVKGSGNTARSNIAISKQPNTDSKMSIDTLYNEYRENMSNEDAQRELIEAFILYLESIRKIKRVANANVVDSKDIIIDGKTLLKSLASNGMLESINYLIRSNPALLDKSKKDLLSEILGYQIGADFIPITTDVLIARVISDETECHN